MRRKVKYPPLGLLGASIDMMEQLHGKPVYDELVVAGGNPGTTAMVEQPDPNNVRRGKGRHYREAPKVNNYKTPSPTTAEDVARVHAADEKRSKKAARLKGTFVHVKRENYG